MEIIENGNVTTPQGYRAATVTAGIKASGKPDMTLIVSDAPARFAAAFTANTMAAPPVHYCRKLCRRSDRLRAIIVNSGNANACTGRRGFQDAQHTCQQVADSLGIDLDEVFVASTGRIGQRLPMEKIQAAIPRLCEGLDPEGGAAAATAIMTTDTVPKTVAARVEIDGVPVVVGGMAKGAGMIAPKLMPPEPHATMLAFVTSDAALEEGVIGDCLARTLPRSFNRITVDGDMSTNDTLVLTANGTAGNTPIRAGTVEADLFQRAVDEVTAHLARAMVLDGEGATKFVTVRVTGARQEVDADAVARAIANSLLCKTAWFGEDPNWGRIVDAAGYAGIELNPEVISLYYDDLAAVRAGMDAGTPEAELAAILKQPGFTVNLDLGLGDAEATIWTCDLSYDYVKINAEYTT